VKVFWWQTGLHLEPESQNEFEALRLLVKSLNVVDVNHSVPRSPIDNSSDENSVGIVNELH